MPEPKKNSKKPKPWSFIERSKQILEQQKNQPASEDHLMQEDNLSEADPDIKESISRSPSSGNTGP